MKNFSMKIDEIKAKNFEIQYGNGKTKQIAVLLDEEYAELFEDIRDSLQEYFERQDIPVRVTNSLLIKKALRSLEKEIQDNLI